MLRIPVIVVFVVTVMLASCSAPSSDPASPPPVETTVPTPTPSPEETQVGESPFVPCDDDNAVALSGLYPGDRHTEPTGDYFPDFLPLPSCAFESADFAQATSFYIPATETDFETLEAAIAAEQGAGVPSDGQGLATAGETWDGQPIQGIVLVPASFGVTLNYIAIRFDFP
jgi:hypothetical protein